MLDDMSAITSILSGYLSNLNLVTLICILLLSHCLYLMNPMVYLMMLQLKFSLLIFLSVAFRAFGLSFKL